MSRPALVRRLADAGYPIHARRLRLLPLDTVPVTIEVPDDGSVVVDCDAVGTYTAHTVRGHVLICTEHETYTARDVPYKNAKPAGRSSFWNIKVTRETRERWTEAARAMGLSRTEMIERAVEQLIGGA